MTNSGYGYDAFKASAQKLLNVPGRKATFYEDLTIEELLAAEKRFLAWYPVTKANKSIKDEKKHLYEQYIKKEIAARKELNTAVEELLF